jgi:hypothetical protein
LALLALLKVCLLVQLKKFQKWRSQNPNLRFFAHYPHCNHRSQVCEENSILNEFSLPFFKPPQNPKNLIDPNAFEALIGAVKYSETSTLKKILFEFSVRN